MKSLLALALLAVVSGMLGTTVYTQQPCQPTVTGKLETFTLESRTFHNSRTLRVWLPPQFDPARRYPVLYILDGASAFDVCASVRGAELRADETLSELIVAGRIPALIAVGIDNGSDVVGNGDGGAGRASEFLAYEDASLGHPFVPQARRVSLSVWARRKSRVGPTPRPSMPSSSMRIASWPQTSRQRCRRPT